LLFARLLVDLFDAANGSNYRLPSLSDLGAYLGRSDAPVEFPSAADGPIRYEQFRALFARVISGPWADDEQRQRAFHHLEAFDRFYAINPG